jgi:LPXTG-site transpeptidase (sortase) family protein
MMSSAVSPPKFRALLVALLALLLAGLLAGLSMATLAQPAAARAEASATPVVQLEQPLAPLAGPDLAITKTHAADFSIGARGGVYSITVANVSTATVTGPITVTDILPSGALTPTAISGAGWSPCGLSGSSVTCVAPNLTGLPPSARLAPILITVTVGQRAAPVITNTVEVTNTTDVNPANNLDRDRTTVTSADVSVTKGATPASPVATGIMTYTLTVLNNGPSAASGIRLTDTLPAGVTFITYTASTGSYTPANGRWTIGDLANGATAVLRIRTQVAANQGTRTITNLTNGLVSSLYDYNAANNSASVGVTVLPLTTLTGRVTDGGNSLPVSAATVVFTDSNSIRYTTSTNASGFYTFTGTLANPIGSGPARGLTASKTGYATQSVIPPPNLTAFAINLQNIVLNTVDLVVYKNDGLTSVLAGQTITYTIVVTNNGSIPAASVVITDILSSYLTYVTDTLKIKPTTSSATTKVWKLPNPLAAKEVLAFTLRARVATSFPATMPTLTNEFKAGSAGPEANKANNTVKDTNGIPVINVTNSVTPAEARVGQNFTFRMRVSNTGSAAATNLFVSNTFPSYLDTVSATSTKGANPSRAIHSINANVGTINPNEVVTVTVVTRVNNTATTTLNLTNSASLSWSQGGRTQTKTSNLVSFRIVFGSTLPGTGFAPAASRLGLQAEVEAGWVFPLRLTLGALGLALLGMTLLRRLKAWQRVALGAGGALLLAGILFIQPRLDQVWLPMVQSRSETHVRRRPAATQVAEASQPWPSMTPEALETLPNFPIPTPQVTVTPGQPAPDTSPVVRLVIPAIELEAVVKYVPFDGTTWMIAGLQQEIAWMGDTSWPGLASNTGLAGHVTLRNGTAGPFSRLSELAEGTQIAVYTEKKIYLYTVKLLREVDDNDLTVVQQTTGSKLTLVTCTAYDAEMKLYLRRLIVQAELTQTRDLPATGGAAPEGEN